ncbi:MAG: transcriptional regulator NrdR [Oscillospiraceae bacterium]|nr:transcriptional regulator NrdR [Oscillospiraceae bacterium]
MKCPACGYAESKVVDTRPAEDNASIRRRRECLECQKRFTTYEVIETIPIVVIKKDQRRESFDRNKILGGILKACEKRPVSKEQMTQITQDIEAQLQNQLQPEISSQKIGELVMEGLKDIDEVAYVRFASVYREFKDINTFLNELKVMITSRKKKRTKKDEL